LTIKNIYNKIAVHPLFWFIAASSMITGLFKEFIILFVIIIVHEIGHLSAAAYFNFKIEKINLYPFGGYIKFNDQLNRSINEELAVLISGPLLQIIYFLIMTFFYNLNFFNASTYNVICNYHYSLLIFNLLPIFPLDGSKLLNLVLSKFISFKLSHLLMIYMSYIFLFILLISAQYISFDINIYFFVALLLTQLISEKKNHKNIYNKFLLERYLYNFHFSKMKIIRGKFLSKMMRDRKHLFIIDKKEVTEKEILRQRYK
jgi:stage IV sporulation protein FB